MNLNPRTLPMAEAAPETNYVVTLLVSAGVVVILAALLAIPAIRTVSGAESSGRPKRWASVATALAALVIPVFIGGRATVHYIDGLDDFTALPDICSSDVLSQDRVAEFIEDPPEPDKRSYSYSASRVVTCDWEHPAVDNDGDGAELYISVMKYDNSRGAAVRLQEDRENAEGHGETVVDLQLGDESIRNTTDATIGSDDSLGVEVEVRIDNVLLHTKFAQSEVRGRPDSDTLETLVTELVREIESRKPRR